VFAEEHSRQTKSRSSNPLLSDGLFFSLIGLVFLGLPYEWTGFLPFLALFHGWNDNLLLTTGHAPTWVGLVAGYVLMFVALWAYRRFALGHAQEKVHTSVDGGRPVHHQAEQYRARHGRATVKKTTALEKVAVDHGR
jgi:hypothetical protein